MSMRKITFRGKRKYDGKWIYGAYIPADYTYWREPSIADNNHRFEIRPETLGLYTGYKDVEGYKIFEEDILETDKEPFGKIIMVVGFGEISGIYAKEKYLGFYVDMRQKNTPRQVLRKSLLDAIKEGAKIIGNIFDNPDLLGDKK